MNYDKNEIKLEIKILKLLAKHDRGLTITDVSKKLGINYMTTSKYLAVLGAKNKVEYRKIGMAKVFEIKKRRKRLTH